MAKDYKIDKGIVSKVREEEPSIALVSEVTDVFLDGSVKIRLRPVGTFVVGTQVELELGLATHTSIQQAHDDALDDQIIYLLPGTFTENITFTKRLYIRGYGRVSLIDGISTINSDYNSIEDVKFGGTVNLNGDGSFLKGWINNGGNVTVSGAGNSVQTIEEN